MCGGNSFLHIGDTKQLLRGAIFPIAVPVRGSAALLAIQLPANAVGKAKVGGPSTGVPNYL